MTLATDAECINIAKLQIAETAINKYILKKIESDLDVDEKVSILFLMVKDYTTAFDEVFGLFKTISTNYVLPNFVEKHHENWTGGAVNLKNLLKSTKQFDNLELITIDLELCESQPIRTQHVLDAHNASPGNVHRANNFSNEERNALPSPKTQTVRRIEKGLCIIINEVFFVGRKYEIRFGSKADSEKLEETFEGFDFEVYRVENLTKPDLLEKLKDIPKQFGIAYDCIFVCILSHGSRGSIITCDEEEVSIETIKNAICCPELTDVIKILVVQACQGKVPGQIPTPATTDGPHESQSANIQLYRNFCIFMSTIQGFVSVRHKIEGSWFIQELCKVLQSAEKEMTFYAIVSKVIQSVENKRGRLDGTDGVAQLPELRSTLVTDFQLPVYRTKK